MKKIIAIAVSAIALCASLAACSSEPANTGSAKPSSTYQGA